MSHTDKQVIQKNKDMDAMLAIGVYLGLFGIAVTSAVFFTETSHGKIVNLVSGILLLIISILAIIRGKTGKVKK